MRNLPLTFDWHYIGQIIGGEFAKFCGLLRIYELYSPHAIKQRLLLRWSALRPSTLGWKIGLRSNLKATLSLLA